MGEQKDAVTQGKWGGTHSRRVRHTHTQERNTGRSNDGAPPFWVHGNGFTPQHRTAEAQSGHNTTQTHQAQVSFCYSLQEGGGLVKTKLTAGRLSPTIITSQHNSTTFLRLHFQEGDGRRTGKEGRRDVTLCSQLGWCVELDNTPEGRDSTMSTTRISVNQYGCFMCQP